MNSGNGVMTMLRALALLPTIVFSAISVASSPVPPSPIVFDSSVTPTVGDCVSVLSSSQYYPIFGTGGVTATDAGSPCGSAGASATYPSVAVVAASNLTLSGAQTVDGSTGTVGQTLVLATAQSTGSQNGPWIMQTGTWTRPAWYPNGGTSQAVQFATTFVRLGTTYQGSVWRQTTAAPITIGTTPTTWAITPVALNTHTVGGSGLPLANIAPITTGTILGAPAVTISGVAITGTAGQISFTASGTVVVGQQVIVSGTFGGSGSIVGYTNPTTYVIGVTNGTSTATLTAVGGAAIVTTAGTPTGLTYSLTAAPGAQPIQTFVGQTVALSTYQGSVCNAAGATSTSGLVDSQQTIVNALAAYAGTNIQLVIDCPIYIAIGTNYAKTIFVPNGVSVRTAGSGVLYVDNIGTPVFIFENSSNSTFTDMQFVYLANFGLPASLPTLAPFSPQNQINSIGVLNYLTANFGNTFTSGGQPVSATAPNNCALIQIRGASNNLKFIGGSATVPLGVAASNFIPMVFSITPEWNAGLTGITSATTVTTANTTIPSNITIAGWAFDGTYMGIQGGATNLIVKDLTSLRYSNLQDGTSGSVTFTGALSSGATTGTLASAWTSPTGTYGLSFPMGATTATSGTGSTATITFSGSATIATNALVNVTNVLPIGYNGWHVVTASSAGSVSFASAVTGSQTHAGTMAQFSFVPLTLGSTATGTFSALGGTATSATAVSGNPGGYSFWFSPPHLLYVDSTAGQSISYPTSFQVSGVKDLGPYVGIATRPSTGYGTYLSLKIEPTNNSVIDGYTSLRPDGIADILSFGTSGGVIRNLYGVFSSATSTSDGSTIWGVRWPSAHPYIDQVMENITVTDSAAAPTQFPINGLTAAGTNNISIRGLKVFMNDYPVGATYNPSFVFLGDKISVQADVFFQSFNSAQGGRGVFQNQGLVTNSNFDIAIHGWRQASLTFTGTLSSGATTATLSSTAFPSGWQLETGTYAITFSDGEVRYALLTNAATTVGTFVALTGNVTASAIAGGSLAVDYANYKQRIFLADNGLGTGNFARIKDVSNGWEATIENGIQTEHYTQMWLGTPTGSTFTTPMVFPSTMALDEVGYKIQTNLDTSNGLTTQGVGCSGFPTALLAAQLATTSFTAAPTFAPTIACGANPILLTPTAGTYGTTGIMQLSVRGSQSLGAN